MEQLAVSGALRTSAGFSHQGPLLIGTTNETWSGWSNFDGTIDTVRLWNSVRTQSDIDATRSAPPASDAPNLVADYRFSASDGAVLVDSASGSHDGQVVNALAPLPGLISGWIGKPGDSASYTFTVASPTSFYVDTLLPNLYAMRWSLSGPSGQLVNRAGFSETERIVALDAGSYVLTVDGDGDVSGSFALRLLDLSTATAIAYDQVVAGQLRPASQSQAYSFDALAGDRVYFYGSRKAAAIPAGVCSIPMAQTAFSYSGFNGIHRDAGARRQVHAVDRRLQRGQRQRRFQLCGPQGGRHPDCLAAGPGHWPGATLILARWATPCNSHPDDWAEAPASTASTIVSVDSGILVQARYQYRHPRRLVYKGNGNASQRQLSVWLNNNGSLLLSTNTNGSEQSVSTPTGSVQPWQRQHVAAVVDRTAKRLKIYLNGVLAADGALANGAALSDANPMLFGATMENYPRLQRESG